MEAGARVGHYEIVGRIGSGGMGEVYRARDTRLSREVAIKVLSPRFALDADRLARFDREARLLAALNHPNIGSIYGIEDGALVLELVEGETLAERLLRGPLAVPRALDIARQIADALDAAHEKGIIHRDLKPANVKITPAGVVKVLDFGIAKSLPPAAPSADDMTATLGVTEEGTRIGTAAYMGPEQTRGLALDRRADIWAFGCVLYEMLAGVRAFGGATVSDIGARVLEWEPDWSRLPPATPGNVQRLIRRCLEKDIRRRLRDVGDARAELEHVEAPAGAAAPRPGRRVPWAAWAALASVAVVALSLIVEPTTLWRRDAVAVNPLDSAQFSRLTNFAGTESDAAISPDGRWAVFLSDRDGPVDVWVTQIGTGEFRNLTAGAVPDLINELVANVGFTGDGTRVWFRRTRPNNAHDTMWVPILGGVPRQFIEDAVSMTWTRDGARLAYHVFTPGDPTFVADRDGANGRQIFGDQPGYHNHFPVWSVDGRYLYVSRGTPATRSMDLWRIAVASGSLERITSHHSWVISPAPLDERTVLYSAVAEDGSGPWLYAVDVEAKTSRRVSLGVEHYTSIAASADGRRLVASATNPTAQLWMAPIGAAIAEESAASPLPISNVRAVGPRYADGGILFLSSSGGTDALWSYKNGVSSEVWRPAEDGQLSAPAVSRDGRRVAFTVRRGGRGQLQVMNADGTNVQTLAQALDVNGVPAWSPDATRLAVVAETSAGSRIFIVPLDGSAPVQIVQTLASSPVWSPDGTRIAYSGPNISLRTELAAVRPDGTPAALPSITVRILGERYRFTPDGKSLVVMKGDWKDQQFYRVDLATGVERRLTNLKPGFTIRSFDLSPDGAHIVFDRISENADIVLIDLKRN